MSQQPTARRRSKRLQTYEEEDGDFVFTRSKRTKISHVESEPVPAPAPSQASGSTVKRGRKALERDENAKDAAVIVAAGKKLARRKLSSGLPPTDKSRTVVSKRRSSGAEPDFDSIDMVGSTEEVARSSDEAGKPSTTIISLPFSDTPTIKRNKELRKKGGSTARRSSLGMRGRRASSLIDNGHSAIPHREVETKEFYKHIESEGLSEPRRMKQLLTWTGERALGDKPSHGDPDSAAHLAARVIKETLLKDFANKSEFSDWFSRVEPARKEIIKVLPNPRKVEIEEKLVGLEERVSRLRQERDQWLALAKPTPPLPPVFPSSSSTTPPNSASQIDTSLLDLEQAAILASLTQPPIQTTIQPRLQQICSTLEFSVDRLAHGVHKLEQYQETAGRAAAKVLALSAVRLEERENREKEAVGTRDLPILEVLRSLSRILPDVSGGAGR